MCPSKLILQLPIFPSQQSHFIIALAQAIGEGKYDLVALLGPRSVVIVAAIVVEGWAAVGHSAVATAPARRSLGEEVSLALGLGVVTTSGRRVITIVVEGWAVRRHDILRPSL
jgi:hypothetical protein